LVNYDVAHHYKELSQFIATEINFRKTLPIYPFQVGFIGSNEGQTWVVKSTGTGTTASSSSMPLVESMS